MNDYNKPAPGFLSLRIIHAAMCLGPALFLGVVTFLNATPTHQSKVSADQTMIYIAIVFAFAMPFIGSYLNNAGVLTIDKTLPADDKFVKYQTACIINYAFVEGAAMFNIVVWLLTQNSAAALLSLMLIIWLIYLRPIKSKISALLQIEYPDTIS